MSGRRAVLWDLDGTLVDSADDHFESWVEALAAHGRIVTRDQFRQTFGQRNDRILATWLGPDTPADLVARIGEEKEIAYRRLVREHGLVPLPGAERWVNQIYDWGCPQAIASSAPRKNVEVVLDVLGWTDRFQAIVGAEDVRRGKPEPDVFLAAAARLQADPAQSLVVEDAAAGIEAARRAGMHSIGVGDAAEAGGPDVAVATLDALTADVWRRFIICR